MPSEASFTLPPDPGYQVLLSASADARILYGYGDPCVVEVEGGGYALTCTSNDAPNAFPVLRSPDLADWSLSGFIFPQGATPAWALTGPGSDYWAPEIHRVGAEHWACYAARRGDHELGVGLARAATPFGPFVDNGRPLLSGGLIDPHIHVDPHEGPILYWKEDHNDLWPGALAAVLASRPELVRAVFPDAGGQAACALALNDWARIRTLAPMARFEALQGLIAAAVGDFARFRARLAGLAAREAQLAPTLDALTTRVWAQRLSADGARLIGEPVMVLQNDQAWEAHLIEGMWLHQAGGRYFLFYSGNDFATPHYGIGVAVGESPFGPFRKGEGPILTSCETWWGPGHPSVALDPSGAPRLFLHAFEPGKVGYKAFRALLSIGLAFEEESVRVIGKR